MIGWYLFENGHDDMPGTLGHNDVSRALGHDDMPAHCALQAVLCGKLRSIAPYQMRSRLSSPPPLPLLMPPLQWRLLAHRPSQQNLKIAQAHVISCVGIQ